MPPEGHSGALATAESVEDCGPGMLAWTTSKVAGSFGLGSQEPVADVLGRWQSLATSLASLGVHRVASATQVHGADLVQHRTGWQGWLRLHGIDGHVTNVPGTALVVTIADCTPVFICHPLGVVAALHAGWRGTAARILDRGLEAMTELGCPPDECRVHLGPAICGACYQVGPEVLAAVLGTSGQNAAQLDVRSILADQAWKRGARAITVSTSCTRCHADQFFSHRGGDAGRQLGIVALLP